MENLRHFVYALISLVSLILTWQHAFDWIAQGGNIANPMSFFIDGINSNSAAAFLSIDILAVWLVYLIWVIPDAIRIGLGLKTGVVFFFLSYLGTCFAFPLYLIVRERFLSKLNTAG